MDHLSRSFADLEDLLDLEIAQLRARAGQLTAEEVDLLRRRVATTVLVPRLVQQLAAVRADEAAFRARLQRLEEAGQHAAIDDWIRTMLAAEYAAGLATVTARRVALEAEAAVWQQHGRSMLEDAATWLREQTELVRARQVVGALQEDTTRERIDSLERELSKVHAARRALEAPTWPAASACYERCLAALENGPAASGNIAPHEEVCVRPRFSVGASVRALPPARGTYLQLPHTQRHRNAAAQTQAPSRPLTQ